MKRILAFLFLTSALLMGSTVTLTLQGTGSESSGGHAISPYLLSVDGILTPAVCDDFLHNVWIGETWQASVLHLSDLPTAQQPLYMEGFWLAQNMLSTPAPHADDQWALWKIFDPGLFIGTAATLRLDWAAGMVTAQPNHDYSGLLIYRPVDTSCDRPQEFIADPPGVPEPTTLVLSGTGLLLLFAGRRRWFQKH